MGLAIELSNAVCLIEINAGRWVRRSAGLAGMDALEHPEQAADEQCCAEHCGERCKPRDGSRCGWMFSPLHGLRLFLWQSMHWCRMSSVVVILSRLLRIAVVHSHLPRQAFPHTRCRTLIFLVERVQPLHDSGVEECCLILSRRGKLLYLLVYMLRSKWFVLIHFSSSFSRA